MPRSLGSMMLRVGLAYQGTTAGNNASRTIPFVKSATIMARLEFTAAVLRVWINDALVTRASVSSAVTNGDFTTNLTGWTDNDEAGATSQWEAGGYLGMFSGTGTAAAIRDQTIVVAGADIGTEHALRIVIQRGPVTVRVGTSTADDSYINETELATGTHSLAFTPTGNFNIRFLSRYEREVLVDSCNIEAAGVMTLPTPYGASDLDYIRAHYDISQSADVMFVACVSYTQRKVERRGTTSWSIVQYFALDGPFRSPNTGPITLTPSGLAGNITLTASAPLFKTTQAPSTNNAGALFQVTSQGQNVLKSITALNDATGSIFVTGVGDQRAFGIGLSGLSATGDTVTLQRSVDNIVFTDIASYTTDQSFGYNDTLDNQELYYRLKCTVYAAGNPIAQLSYAQGSITGVARITSYSSSTVANVEVLTDMGSGSATDNWAEGSWSDYRGWPSSVGLYESRLAWAGLGTLDISTTDAFDTFQVFNSDGSLVGDSGPISRTIGSGPLETINWLLPLQRILMGGTVAEHSVRSSAFDDPLTPSNCNIKPCSTQGSAPVQGLRIDSRGMFTQRGGTRVFELDYDQNGYDYTSTDLTVMVPEIGRGIDSDENSTTHIVRMAVQRQPDTRIHVVRSDGLAAVLVYDKAENVLCWVEVSCALSAGGVIEDVCVLPSMSGQREDQVYYTVKYTINGATVRYQMKWALESECIGGTLNKQADAFVTGTNSPASVTISGLSHLEGEDVIVWADGACPADADQNIMTYTVTGGVITLDAPVTNYVVGLPYTADWNSSKLGNALGHFKRVSDVALILKDTHALGIKFGPDADNLDNLSQSYQGAPVDPDTVYSEFDQDPMSFPGGWKIDSRLYLQAAAPRPVTILAAVVQGEVNA